MQARTQIPVYLDGCFRLYEMYEIGNYPRQKIRYTGVDICYEELSVFDSLKFSLSANNIEVTHKLRIPQYRKIGSSSVVKIGEGFYHVINAAHFINKDGYPQTDVTLELFNDDVEECDEKG